MSNANANAVSRAAYSEVERREYIVKASNKRIIQVREQRVIEHVQIRVHALKPARVASPCEEKINECRYAGSGRSGFSQR